MKGAQIGAYPQSGLADYRADSGQDARKIRIMLHTFAAGYQADAVGSVPLGRLGPLQNILF